MRKKTISEKIQTWLCQLFMTKFVKETIKKSNAQTSDDIAFTADPIFLVQSMEFVACIDSDWRCETEGSEEIVRKEFRYDDGSYTREQAREYLKENYSDEEYYDTFDQYPQWETDDDDLDSLWEDLTGFDSCYSLYRYQTQNYFLTRDAAKQHIKAKAHRYNKPRIYVDSLYHSPEFRSFFEDLGMAMYE